MRRLENRGKAPNKPKLTAYEYAVYILSRGDYSRRALKEKLGRKYPLGEAGAALELLTEQGYIDESRMVNAAWDCLYAEGNLPLRMIRQKLLDKGFPYELVAAKAEEIDEAAAWEHDLAAGRKLAGRKFGGAGDSRDGDGDLESRDYHQRRREWENVAAFLYRKGFESSVCRQVANEIAGKED